MTTARRLDPRYKIVVSAWLTQFTVVGILFTNGLFFKIYEVEFGWSRTLVSASSSLAMLMMGVFAILAGRMADRYGPRVVLGTAALIFGSGFALLSQIGEPWQLFVLFGLFISVGLSTSDVVTLSMIARWFHRRRGVMTGVAKVGTAGGQMAIPPLTALMIAALGWRDAVAVIGVVAGIVLFGAAMMMSLPPRPAGDDRQAPREGVSYSQARRSRVFWTLCGIQFLFFPTLTTIPLHIVAHGMDLGMTAAVAAGLLSVSGGASVAGRLTVGTFSDRIGGRNAYVLCFVPLIASLLALLVIDQPWTLFAVIAVYGFGHGGLFTVVSPTIAEFFGMRAHGAIFGVVLFCGTIGGAIGPILAGRVFDTTGSYAWAFLALAAFSVLGLGLALTLPRRQAAKALA